MSVIRPLLLTSLLATGCTVGPNYVRPADPSQTTYVTSGHTGAVAFGETPPDDWWTLLGSEQLDQPAAIVTSVGGEDDRGGVHHTRQ